MVAECMRFHSLNLSEHLGVSPIDLDKKGGSISQCFTGLVGV
jgi:hypothetical protein